MSMLRKRWPLTLAVLLLLCCGFCVWRLGTVSNLLTSQQAAQRWKGDNDQDFAQISVFMPPIMQLSLDNAYKFRNDMLQKLKGAGYDIAAQKGLYADAWSTFNTAKVSVGQRSGEVQLVAVGGYFFDIHPLRLVSGNYLRPNDVMDDRVLLDQETAWLLFGSSDVAGLSFSLNGMPVVAAGVYEHEQDRFSKLAYSGSMRIYISFNAYRKLFSTDSQPANAIVDSVQTIQCYELIMAEPVKGFAYSSVTDKFPIKNAVIVENSYRFDSDRLLALLKNMSTRSMQTGVVVYPYWENAARAAEDRASLWFLAAALTGALPAALLLYYGVLGAVYGKRKLEKDLIPGARAKSREFVRERSRRRWEKKHPGEY